MIRHTKLILVHNNLLWHNISLIGLFIHLHDHPGTGVLVPSLLHWYFPLCSFCRFVMFVVHFLLASHLLCSWHNCPTCAVHDDIDGWWSGKFGLQQQDHEHDCNRWAQQKSEDENHIREQHSGNNFQLLIRDTRVARWALQLSMVFVWYTWIAAINGLRVIHLDSAAIEIPVRVSMQLQLSGLSLQPSSIQFNIYSYKLKLCQLTPQSLIPGIPLSQAWYKSRRGCSAPPPIWKVSVLVLPHPADQGLAFARSASHLLVLRLY